MPAAKAVGKGGVNFLEAGMAIGDRVEIMIVRLVSFLAAVVLFGAVGVGQTVIYVNAAAAPGGNGQSWATAYQTIEPALADAKLLPDAARNVQVWVARGVYNPTRRLIANEPRSVVFELASGISILGGFAGGELLASQANPTANVTQISGDIGVPGDGIDSVFRLFLIQGCQGVKLDGLTITDALSQSINNFSYPGCAVYAANSIVELSRLCVRGNGDFGTAQITVVLATGVGTSLTVRDSEFQNNSRTAIRCSPDAELFVQRCQFLGNGAATPLPAGIWAESRTRTHIVGCRFIRNTGTGGAMLLQSDSGVFNIVNCEFLGNNASVGGGAIGTLGRTLAGSAEVLIANSLFVGNIAQTGLGGAISHSGMSVNIVNCTITQNFQSGGGAVSAYLSTANVPTSISVRNSIIWQNPSIGNSQQSNLFLAAQVTNVGISNCLIGGWNGSLAGTSVSAADPGLLDMPNPGPDGFWLLDTDVLTKVRLASTSPAIDAGSNATLPADVTDLDGDGDVLEPMPLDLYDSTRRRDDPVTADTGLGSAPIVDIGCVEYWYDCSTCAGPREWRNPTGGNYTDSFNWFPSLPTATDNLSFALNGTYSVALPASISFSVRAAALSRGAITWTVPPSTLVGLTSLTASALSIGTLPGVPASLTVTGPGAGSGGLVRPAGALIAPEIGSIGTLNVSGLGTRFSILSQDLTVGFQGVGAFNLTQGARADTRLASIGDQPGSLGTAVVDGPGSQWTVPFFLSINSGSVTVRNGGVLDTGFGTFLFQNGSLTGDGTIQGPVINFGTVTPGLLNTTGVMTLNGDYSQFGELLGDSPDSGLLSLRVAGTTPGSLHDQLIVNGQAELAGGLFVQFLNGFVPPLNSNIELFSATSATATGQTFDIAVLPPLNDGRFLRVDYGSARGPGGRGPGFSVRLAAAPLGGGTDIGPPQTAGVGGSPTNAVIADFNADGADDLAITVPAVNATGAAGSVVVLFSAGNDNAGNWLGFAGQQTITVQNEPLGLDVGDLNGDGRPDLAVANSTSNSVSVLLNSGGGTVFPSTITVPSVGTRPVALAIANFDTDPISSETLPEIAVACQTSNEVRVLRSSGGGTAYATAIGGVVALPAGSAVGPGGTICAVDPDQDKNLRRRRLTVALSGLNSIVVVNNTASARGPGLSLVLGTPVPVGPSPSQIIGVNLRPALGPSLPPNVGNADLVVRNSDGTLSVLLGDTPTPATLATFRPAVSVPVSTSVLSITSLDIDTDGDPDLAALTPGGSDTVVQIIRNDYLTRDPSNVISQSNAQPVLVPNAVPSLVGGALAKIVVSGRLSGVANAPADIATIADPPPPFFVGDRTDAERLAIGAGTLTRGALGRGIAALSNVRGFPNRRTSSGGAPCNPADICGVGATYDNGSVDIGPDQQLTIEDFLNFLSAFGDLTGCPGSAPCNPADICGVGATYDNGAVDIGPDGELTIEDFLNFLSAFGDAVGCS